MYFWQTCSAACTVGELTSIPLEGPGKKLVLPFDDTGSGQLGTPCDRMHSANSNPAEATSPGAERPPAGPDNPEVPDEDPGWVVVVDAAGTVVADEAVVPMWATELGPAPAR